MELPDIAVAFPSSRDDVLSSILFESTTPRSFDQQLNAITAFLDEQTSTEGVTGMHLPAEVELTSDSSGTSDLLTCSTGFDSPDDDMSVPMRGKSYHGKRKEEIQRLRKKVREMESTIQHLESKFIRAKASASSTTRAVTSSRARHLWRQVALSQLELRRKAEADNADLREMVELQLLEAKNLRRVLKRRTRIEMMQGMLGLKEINLLTARAPKTFPSSFHELEIDTAKLFGAASALFSTTGITFPEYSRRLDMDTRSGVYMEIRQQHLLPFSFQESQRGVWDSLSHFAMSSMRELGDLKAQITHHPQYSDTEGDTLRTSFVAVVTGVAGLAGSYLRKVLRRHISEDRAVFIFRLVSETMLSDGRSGIREVTTMHVVLEKTVGEDGRELMPSLKTYLTVERDTPIKQDPAGPLAVAAWIELASQFARNVETAVLDTTSRT